MKDLNMQKSKNLMMGVTLIILSLFKFSLFGAPSTTSKFITIDQFGYQPNAGKVAVIRNPEKGYDSSETFNPGPTYQLRKWENDQIVFSSNITAWNGGAVDPSSGDKAWWFDFSQVKEEGEYYVFDPTNNVGSYKFRIAYDVYDEVLKHTVRMLFYQRAGFPKDAKYAGVGWADAASHIKPRQDKNARIWNDTTNAATERDVSGNWYDAGDQHRYGPDALKYCANLILAFEENPDVWRDDYNIPESGNGIPDLLDEWKFGMDWGLKAQLANGSIISKVDVHQTSPPSASWRPSRYGSPSTQTALAGAASFAVGSTVIKKLGPPAWKTYAETLLASAKKAWDWAVANPDSSFGHHSLKLAPRAKRPVQEWIRAAVYLFEATGEKKYRDTIDNNYRKTPLYLWGGSFIDQYRDEYEYLLRYAALPNATASVASSIRSTVLAAFTNPTRYGGLLKTGTSDPYRAFVGDYNWGSNQYKAGNGNAFHYMATYGIDPAAKDLYINAAADYVHYINGVNPFGFVYLTNMNSFGAENSITQIWHIWFSGPKWDQVGVSQYGPPPGYLTGGPFKNYQPDSASCPNWRTTGMCAGRTFLPPALQPAQKAYKDFNDSWPDKAWTISEPSMAYQTPFIRLLSKFATPVSASVFYRNTQYGGESVLLTEGTYTTAQLAALGIRDNDVSSLKAPAGYMVEMYEGDNFTGTKYTVVGTEPDLVAKGFNDRMSSVKIIKNSVVTTENDHEIHNESVKIFPNPNHGEFKIILPENISSKLEVYNTLGQMVYQRSHAGSTDLQLVGLSKGVYILKIKSGDLTNEQKIIIE